MIKQQVFYCICLLSMCFTAIACKAQVCVIGFYNCENYYDTIHQANVIDEDFLPSSEKKYSENVFNIKSQHLANVLYKLGKLNDADGLALIGLVEIENKMVLNKLINEPLLKKYHYKFIHFDSKDPRGVDVALIYNPAHFVPYQYRPYSLTDETHFTHYATRDILFVKGKLENEWVSILVNHWPSRRGGESLSASKRNWAAFNCKKIMDSLRQQAPQTKFIVMGDFNDNPNNRSIKILQMTNPFMKWYKKGIGSIAFNDSWSLFDQILLSPNWMESKVSDSLHFSLNNYKSIIYNNSSMVEMTGKYRGYPKRTFNGNQFQSGYSDHFPVALIFTLKSGGNTQ